MSKFLKAVLSAEERLGEIVSGHKLLKTAIALEENAGKIKTIVLQKAVMGLTLLNNKLQK